MVQLFKEMMAFCRKGLKKIRVQAERLELLLKHHRLATTLTASLLTLAMLMSVMTVTIHKVVVLDEGKEIAAFHSVFTEEQAILENAELTLKEGDETVLTEKDGTITLSIIRAFPVEIFADGQEQTVYLTKGTVTDALKKAKITPNEADLLSPAAEEAVKSGMKIRLDRVTTATVEETVSVKYKTKEISTNDLYVGNSKVVQEGKKGSKLNTYTVTYVNGKETSRKLIASEMIEEPIEKIVKVGAKYKSTFKKTSSTPKKYKKVIAMEATAYAAGGSTATGRPAQWGVVAVDPRVIPLGTKVYVETADGKYIYGTAIAADTGGAIKGNKIDICVNTRAQAYQFGRRIVNVYIL